MIPIERYRSYRAFSCACLYTIIFYASRLLTNDSTPGGDANRVIAYIRSAKQSSSYLPLWDPFTAMGKPAFADAEWLFYRIVSPVFNLFPPEYYNLSFNLALLLLLLCLLLVLFQLARTFRIGTELAACFAAVAVCSGYTWSSVESGRLNTLVIAISSLMLIPLYHNWQRTKRPLLGIGLVSAISVSLLFAGYYALVGYVLFWSYVFGSELERAPSFVRAFLSSVAQVGGFGLCALMLAALFMFPMIESQFNLLLSQKGWGTDYQALLSKSIFRIFVPFYAEQKSLKLLFPYVSFLVLPGLVCLLFVRSNVFSKPVLSVVAVGVVYLLLAIGFGFSVSTFREYYGAIPIVNLMRWGSFYAQYALLVMLLLSFIGFSNLSKNSSLRAITVVSVFVTLGLLWSSYDNSVSDTTLIGYRLWVVAGLLAFLVLICITFSVVADRHSVLAVVVVGLFVHLFTPRPAFFAHQSQKETPRSTNDIGVLNLVSVNTFPSGVRQYCLKMASCPIGGVSSVYGFNGFSMVFSDQARNAYSQVFTQAISATRPHWVNRQRCDKLNPVGLAMANVKLIFCRGKRKPPGESWSEAAKLEHATLWYQREDTSPFKLFFSASKSSQEMSTSLIEKNWLSKNLIITKGGENFETTPESQIGSGGVEILRWSDDSIELSVNSGRAGYLFSSILYDKGWQVRVNAMPVETYEVYGSFLAFEVPPHTSQVQLDYIPRSWQIGRWLSVMSFLLMITVFCMIRRQTNRIQSVEASS